MKLFSKKFFLLPLGLILLGSSAVCQKPYRGAEYRTTAALQYGRFEVRLRSAPVSGMLSSFFTYYNPASPWNEIDIEVMGRYSNEVQFNTIVPTQADNHVQRQIVPFNPHSAFHVYAVEWTPDYVAWLIDGTEVYRQTGTHIEQLSHAQQLMMNIWQPSSVDWAGAFNSSSLPVYAYYDWVKYYAYTPGTGDNFTLQWVDNFNAFDPTRWARATHTWEGNNSQFVQENAAFKDGYMILCLTDNQHSGYAGAAIADADIDPPYPVSARASGNFIKVGFSERLGTVSAETPGNYIVPGAVVSSAKLLEDRRSVSVGTNGLNPTASYNLIALNVKDSAGNTMGGKSIKVAMPLPFPVRVNVGGGALAGYLADSIWNFSAMYGAVGGAIVQQPGTLDIGGTAEDSLYRSAREGLSFYRVRVPDGSHVRVQLMLVEPQFQAAGQRVFDVRVNGSAPSRVDIYQQAGQNNALPLDLGTFAAPDGLIDIYFAPVVGKPIISGVIIQQLADAVGEEAGAATGPSIGFGVYPNPFNGSTNFQYSLPQPEEVVFHVYDLLGQALSTVVLGYQQAGNHMVRWNGEGLATGIYICSMTAGSQRLTQRVLLIK